MAAFIFNGRWKWPAAMAVAGLMAASAQAASLTVKVSDAAGNPLADAVIYALPRAGTHIAARTPRPVAIEQKDREFVPWVSVVQVGTTVNFPNRDPLMHHVYSFSPAKSFEIKLYSGEAPRTILFDKPGTVTLGCNIHDWMIGYIQVVETPHFAKTGSDGRAPIGDLAAGEYALHLWHPTQRAAADAKPVKLDARSHVELDFSLDVAPRKKPFKPPLDGVRYK
ncbi:MAG: methylamine utilization protein [Betaproteobacteria bacterium]